MNVTDKRSNGKASQKFLGELLIVDLVRIDVGVERFDSLKQTLQLAGMGDHHCQVELLLKK